MQPATLETGLRFPEGPAFDPRGNLWAVELKGEGLIRRGTEGAVRVPTGGAPNGIAIDAAGRIWFCDAERREIRVHDPRDGATRTAASEFEGSPLNKPNDLAFDASGNLVFTCPGDSRQEPTGVVCALSPSGAVSRVADGMFFPNGLAFTPDGRELVVAETYRQRLWRGEWSAAERRWIAPRVWAEGLQGAPGPDGMAFAEDGTLFVAVYGSGTVMRVDPCGAIVERHPLAGRNPTNCAFDPSGALGLVVTEAERGEIVSLPVGVRGVPLFRGPS